MSPTDRNKSAQTPFFVKETKKADKQTHRRRQLLKKDD